MGLWSALGVVTARVRYVPSYVPSGSLTSHRINCDELWDGTSGLSSLSESVGPVGVWTHDLPHGSPALYQLSQPVGC